MTREEYLTSTNVKGMLVFLEKQGKLDRRSGVLFACRCAARTLKHWRKEHPEDKRPRDALRTTLRWWAGRATIEEVQAAANSAYATYATYATAGNATYATYAGNAANAAANAAAYAAYAAYAANAAAYAAAYATTYAANAAYAAGNAANNSVHAARRREVEWQANLLRKMFDLRHPLERLATLGKTNNYHTRQLHG